MAASEWLVAGRLDLAVMFDPPVSPQLVFETLMREALLLVSSARAERLPKRIGLQALSRYPMILPGVPNAVRTLIDDALRPHRIALQLVAEVGAVQTMLPLAAQGVGCTILPEGAVAAYVEDGSLQMARIGPPAIRNTVVLASTPARPSNRLTRATSQLTKALMAREAE
jgi:LysR family nitrogen assimilation transcriptional regulator